MIAKNAADAAAALAAAGGTGGTTTGDKTTGGTTDGVDDTVATDTTVTPGYIADLEALGIKVDGEYDRAEGELVYDVMQNYAGEGGLSNQAVATYYGIDDAADVAAAADTIAGRRATGVQLADANVTGAANDQGGYIPEEIDAVFDMLTTGDVSIDAAADYFQVPPEEIEANMAAIQQDRTNKAELKSFGTLANIRSQEEIDAIAQGITDGKWDVGDVAAQFNVEVADVQTEFNALAAATGGRMASGGQAGTKRFMTSMGPIELAGGGIAEIPVNQEFMQEMPPEMAMVQEQVIAEEPLDTDYNELIALTVEAIRGNIEDSDAVINMFIEEYGQEKFLELRTAVLQSIVPNAQTEGLIAGSGNGMDDEVMGMIGENQQVAVSPGEYIVAADVLSGLGDGDTDAGADVMDEVQANVRMARSGGRQPAPIDLSKVMPA